VRHRVTVTLRLRRRTFGPDDLLVMAILNRTPDSFYDRGATYDDEPALAAVDRAAAAGADIVDIGGVKAGPGDEVDAAEEIRRVAPSAHLVMLTTHIADQLTDELRRAGCAEVLAKSHADTSLIPAIEARKIPGFRHIDLMKRDLGGEIEFQTCMWFDSLDAIRAFMGEDYAVSHVPMEARAVLNSFDDRAAHYEVIDRREQ